MNEVNWIKSLDRAARSAVPVVDVVPGVMQAMRERSIEPDEDSVFRIAAAVAVIVGVTAIVLASLGWSEPLRSTEPFANFGEPVNLVLR